ncbi:MAG: C1 family peptidase [Acidobacteriota bacterium]|jgi:hypothetical protein
MRITDDLKRSVEPLRGRLPEEQTQRLASLGITTAEELRDQLAYSNPMLLYDFLDSPGAPAAPVLRATRVAKSAWGRSAAMAPYRIFSSAYGKETPPLLRRPRGVLLAEAQRSRRGLPPPGIRSHVEEEPSVGVDLRARMPDVRSQGNRPTSVAFAVCAIREALLKTSDEKMIALSSQYLYWACKERDGEPKEEGTRLSVAVDVLREVGVPPARTWRYSPSPDPTGNEGQGPPPKEAGLRSKAGPYKVNRFMRLRSRDVRALRAILDSENPIAFAINTFASWDYPATVLSGDVPLPLPGENTDGGQAVAVVGYEDNGDLPGGGGFIIQNSWGAGWGVKSRYGPGYGTISYAYASLYGLEAYTLER